MKSLAYLSTLTAGLLLLSSSATMAAQGQSSGRRGGAAESHMSIKGEKNTNAQWSADPEKGQDRADERHELHEDRLTGKHSGSKINKDTLQHQPQVPKGKAKGSFAR